MICNYFSSSSEVGEGEEFINTTTAHSKHAQKALRKYDLAIKIFQFRAFQTKLGTFRDVSLLAEPGQTIRRSSVQRGREIDASYA